jgi:hypothetical protein
MDDEPLSGEFESGTVWLSGEILTFLSKLVMPAIWLAAVIALPLWVWLETGRLTIPPGFRSIVFFTGIATVLLTWFTAHLQRVGYCGSELVVANYWRSARISFQRIEAVESVWWNKGRVVRIRFSEPTPFGSTVYYMPKWGPLLAMVSAPEKELIDIISSRSRFRSPLDQ